MAKVAGPHRRKVAEEGDLKSVAEKALAYVQEKPRETAMAATAVAAVLLVALLSFYFVERAETARIAAVTGAITRYTASVSDADADVESLRADLEAVARTYASSEMGGQALYYLGGALSREGKHEEAAQVYLDVHNTFSDNGTLAGAALLGAAYSYAAAGKGDEALEHFGSILENGEQAAPRSQIRLEVARILKHQGDREGAAAELHTLLEEHPDGPQADEARLLLAVLEGS